MYEAYQSNSLVQLMERLNDSKGELVSITAVPQRVDGMEGFLYIIVIKKGRTAV